MSDSSRKRVLVTGASAGIGYAACLHLARRGYLVTATSRALPRLNSLMERARAESLPISPYELDVNDDTSIDEVMPRILEETSGIDGLVNNAGYGLWGCLEDLTIDEVRAQFETNVFAVLKLSQAVLPQMRERGFGTIVNVGSVTGRVGAPAGGAYSATKFALAGLSAVMRMEVAPFGVRVVLVEPGSFKTDFVRNLVYGERTTDPGSAYGLYNARMNRQPSDGWRWSGDPMKVARVIEGILRTRHTRPRYSVGLDSRLASIATRLLPDSVIQYVVRRVMAR